MSPPAHPKPIISRGELELLELDTKETLSSWYHYLPRNDNDYYYNRDGIRLIQAAQDFREGKGLTPAGKHIALQKWYLSLDMLKSANIIYGHRYGLKILRTLIQLEILGIKILRRLPGKVEELTKKLEALKKMLEQAKSNVAEAKLQTVIDIGINVVSLALGPAGLMGRALLAVGSFAVATAVDYYLGPDKYGLATVNNATGDLVGAANTFGKATPLVSGILSFKLDLDEIDSAEAQVAVIRREVTKAAKVLETFVEFMEKHKDSIKKLAGRIYFRNKKVNELFQEIDDAQTNYDIIESEYLKL